jgi:predicted amidophosphoribosyltransferase
MVLEPPNNDKLKEVFHLYDYHPYKMPDGSKNPVFNANGTDSLILDVKLDRKPAAIARFVKAIDDLACADIVVSVVPGHDPTKKDQSGIAMIAQALAALNGRVDGTGVLVRHTKIEKLATGGNRAIEVHLDSIRTVDKKKILDGASVLLLDDVATSDNSLRACKRLLRDAGARQVQMFALGKTVR